MSKLPKLRFSGFSGEWEEKPLSKISNIITGNTPKTADASNYGGKKLFVSPVDISDERYLISTKTTLTKQGYKKTRPIKANSIMFVCIGSTIGKVAQNKAECATNQQINSVIPFDGYSNDYIYSFLEKNSDVIAGIAGNHAVPIINKTLFSSVLINCPTTLDEQQKIANCLSSIDTLITAQTQKLDTLKAHKKGLMQQLFPATGETVPKLRFPEFRDTGDWEEIKLGNVSVHFKGFAFKSKDYTTSGKRVVRVSDMGFDYIKNETNAIYIKETKLYEKWKLLKDDLIITTVGSKPPVYDSLVGRTIVVKLKDEGSLLNQNAVCLRANHNVEQGFLNALFRRKEYISFIESIIRGNANQGSIALVDLFKYVILKPKSKEQQKIANCLSSLDDLITTQTQKIASLKAHKKGLMQQLFPSTEETA